MLFRSNDTATTEIYTSSYTLSLHDALPISEIYTSSYTLSLHDALPILPPADFGPTDADSLQALGVLAARMTADPDPAKDGPDPEESGIPSAYTYLGQFIDHDLTFDPASSLQRQNDPDALVDFRTPRFDLDSVYGRGPDDQPYLYEGVRKFLLGRPLTGAASNPGARDLPRSEQTDAVTRLHMTPRHAARSL